MLSPHRADERPAQAIPEIIRADLCGDDVCTAYGYSVRSSSPVLALCRDLIAAGHDPHEPLEAYRGDVLALRVRSIGEAARLSIAGDGVGFRRVREPVGVSPVGSPEKTDPEGEGGAP